MSRGPYLPNLEPFIAAGIDPKTGLPIKVLSGDKTHLKEDVKKFLRLIDEQDFCNRYVWYNLPCDLTSQELERMLYYKGQLCFFYNKEDGKFYFMPYTLDGTIDFYGRYNRIHPIPFTSGVEDKENKATGSRVAQLLSQKKLECVYGMKQYIEVDDFFNSTVLLHDYTKQLPQSIIPRVLINDPLLDIMAECVAMARTSRLLSTGVTGIRVGSEDEAINVTDANRLLEISSLEGKAYVPIVGTVEFQQLNEGTAMKGEEYMLAMQSLDNLRLSGYGIDNGGLFEKKAHELQSEADINGGPVGLVLQDGLSIRQNFCNIVNSIWGVGIWCEAAQNISGMDNDGDGAIDEDNSDGANTGVEGDTQNE